MSPVLSKTVKLTGGLCDYTENIFLVSLSVGAWPTECEVVKICVSQLPKQTTTDFRAELLTCKWLVGV